MNKLILVVLFIGIATTSTADTNQLQIKEYFAENFTPKLCNTDFLVCINVTAAKCAKSVEIATKSCPIDAGADSSHFAKPSIESQIHSLLNELDIYSECVLNNFFQSIPTTEDKLPSCLGHIGEYEILE